MRNFCSVRIKTLLTISLVVSLGGLVNGGRYAGWIEKYFSDLKSKYPDSAKCVDKAKVKMAHVSSSTHMYNEDNLRAIALVNLFTQPCQLEQNGFHNLLNSNLRTGHPTPFWQTAESLLSQGMVLLGESYFADVYRGCGHPYAFQPGTLVRFNQFLSTSLSGLTAAVFALKSYRPWSSVMIFNIKDAVGLDVSGYSHYPGEKEVLIKSSSVFEVVSSSNRIFYHYVVLRYTAQAYGTVTDLTCECELTTSALSIAACIITIIAVFAGTAFFVWRIYQHVR